MIIELLKTPEYTKIYISDDNKPYRVILQESGFTRTSCEDIRDWEQMDTFGIINLYTDGKYLYSYDGWYEDRLGEYVRFKIVARVIPSTKFDLGTKIIELTDAEIYAIRTEFRNIDLMNDIQERWDELTDDGEIPEGLNPDVTHLLELVESRQTGDFTYNDAYWRTIEDAIEDYLTEAED